MDDAVDGDDPAPESQSRHFTAMQDLTAAMAAGGASFAERVEPVLAVGREHLDFSKGYVAFVSGEEHEIVASTARIDEIPIGMTSPLAETFCRHTLEGDGINVLGDLDETLPADPAQDRFDLRSYIGTTLETEEGVYGTLCFVDDSDPLDGLSAWQRTLFEHLTQWVEAEIERELAVETRDRSQRLLEATFNSPETFIGILDSDGSLIRANETALQFIDAEEGDLAGRAFWETPWWDHDEAIQSRCRDAIERATAGETVRFEAEHVGTDGQRISTAVVARPVQTGGAVQEIIIEGTDITDLKRHEEQMEFFNSILRHDIFNGMNVIEARAERLSDTLTGTEATYVETILDWSRDIVDLTQKVRSVLNTMSEDGLTNKEAVELAPAIEAAGARAASMADGCTLETDVHDDAAVVAGDLLDDVLGNILTNAVEHGGPEPTIRVTTERDESIVRIHVADDGPGIPSEQREAVFEKGECGTESTGTGFGLYFVSVMVESYGGDIWVENSDLGGSEFVVELPRE